MAVYTKSDDKMHQGAWEKRKFETEKPSSSTEKSAKILETFGAGKPLQSLKFSGIATEKSSKVLKSTSNKIFEAGKPLQSLKFSGIVTEKSGKVLKSTSTKNSKEIFGAEKFPNLKLSGIATERSGKVLKSTSIKKSNKIFQSLKFSGILTTEKSGKMLRQSGTLAIKSRGKC